MPMEQRLTKRVPERNLLSQLRPRAMRPSTLGQMRDFVVSSITPRRAPATTPAPGRSAVPSTTRARPAASATPARAQSAPVRTTTHRGGSRSVGPSRERSRPPSAYVAPRPLPDRPRQNSRRPRSARPVPRYPPAEAPNPGPEVPPPRHRQCQSQTITPPSRLA